VKPITLKILPLLLVLLIPFQLTAFSQPKNENEELSQKRQELNKVYEELEQSKAKLQRTKREQQNVVQRLFVINRSLTKTKTQLGRAEQQIQVNQRKLNFLTVSIEDAKKRLENRSDFLRSRIREIYKSGGINYIQMMLSSDTLSDFINKSYFFEKIMSRDVSLVNEISSEHKKIVTNKSQLEGVTEDIKTLASYIEHKKQTIEKQAEEKKKVYEELEERRKDYEKKIEELEKTSKEIETMIQRIVAEKASKGVAMGKGTGNFIWPVRGRLTSMYGYRRSPFSGRRNMHTGLDIANSYGTPIHAADGGEVLFAGWWGGYGKAVIIYHGRGLSTVYGHMSRIYVQKDQMVDKGQVVGLIGSTGYSTGPHLHFEVRKNGATQDPLRSLP